MSQQVQKTEGAAVAAFQIGEKEIETLTGAGIIPVGTPPAQIQVFSHVCNLHGMDPFAGEIHLVGYNTKAGPKYATIVGIHGLERRAEESGKYAGADEPQFNHTADGKYMTMAEVVKSRQMPISCRVTVYKIVSGMRVPFVGEVLFSEFAGTSPQWNQRPIHMIAKCARAQALRAGFPRQTAGLLVDEERAAFEGTTSPDLDLSTPPKGASPDAYDAVDESDLMRVKSDLRMVVMASGATPEAAEESRGVLKELWKALTEGQRKNPEVIALFKEAGRDIASKVEAAAADTADIEDAEIDDDDDTDQ